MSNNENKRFNIVIRHQRLQKLSTFQKWCALITFLIVLLTTLPFTIVLLIGMLPTFTILLTDPRNSSKLIIVGCFNLAGVFVYILDIIGNFSLRMLLWSSATFSI